MSDKTKKILQLMPAAATAALDASAGMLLVPREPTDAMLEAGFEARRKFGFAEIIEGYEADIYRAMLSAAPAAD